MKLIRTTTTQALIATLLLASSPTQISAKPTFLDIPRGGFSPALLTPLRAAEMTAHMDTSSVVFFASPKIALKQFGTQLDRSNPRLLAMASNISTTHLQLFLVEAFIFFAKMHPTKAVILSFIPRIWESLKALVQSQSQQSQSQSQSQSSSIQRQQPTPSSSAATSGSNKRTIRGHVINVAVFAGGILSGLATPAVGVTFFKAMASFGLAKSLARIMSPQQQSEQDYNRKDEVTTYLTRSQGYSGLQVNCLVLMLLNGVQAHRALAFSLSVTIIQGLLSMCFHDDVGRFGTLPSVAGSYSTERLPCMV